MHRIDTATKSNDLFGPGKHGFKDGDPLTGAPSTTLNAAFFNTVQEEIAGVIESVGATLDPADNGQLLAALGLADLSLTNPGRFRLGKVIVQWGQVVFGDVYTNPQAGGPYLFHKPFSTECLVVLPVLSTIGASTNRINGSMALLDKTKDGFSVVMSEWNTLETTDYRIAYIAIGY